MTGGHCARYSSRKWWVMLDVRLCTGPNEPEEKAYRSMNSVGGLGRELWYRVSSSKMPFFVRGACEHVSFFKFVRLLTPATG